MKQTDQMDRQLPKWMSDQSVVETRVKTGETSEVKQVNIDSFVCEKRLVYVMSPRELQMAAKEILQTLK